MLKTVFKAALAAACTALLFSACVKQQSSMSVDDISGKAVISGRLTYSEGQDYKNGQFIEPIIPAAGVTVYAEISNDSFKDGAGGITTFTTVTDADGNYSFSVPATPTGVDVTIRANDFVGVRTQVSGFDDRGGIEFEEKDCIYRLEPYECNVKPGSLENYTALFGYKDNAAIEEFKAYAPFKIRVGLGVMKKYSGSDGYTVLHVYDAPDETVNLLIKVRYSDNSFKTYGVTANSSGIAEIDIPVYEAKCDLDLEITAMPYLCEEWTEYYKENESDREYKQRRHDGIAEQYDFREQRFGVPERYSQSVTGIEGIVSSLDVHLIFHTHEGSETYFNTPEGWKYAGFDEN